MNGKQFMKRLISILLTLIIVFGMLPVTAYAENKTIEDEELHIYTTGSVLKIDRPDMISDAYGSKSIYEMSLDFYDGFDEHALHIEYYWGSVKTYYSSETFSWDLRNMYLLKSSAIEYDNYENLFSVDTSTGEVFLKVGAIVRATVTYSLGHRTYAFSGELQTSNKLSLGNLYPGTVNDLNLSVEDGELRLNVGKDYVNPPSTTYYCITFYGNKIAYYNSSTQTYKYNDNAFYNNMGRAKPYTTIPQKLIEDLLADSNFAPETIVTISAYSCLEDKVTVGTSSEQNITRKTDTMKISTTLGAIAAMYDAPTITEQPEAVSALVGDVISFTIDGDEIADAKWYVTDEEADPEKAYSWSEVKEHAQVSGYLSTDLKLTATDTWLDGKYVFCQVKNDQGIIATSDLAKIDIGELPSVTTQPQSTQGKISSIRTYQVQASNYETVLWYVADKGVNGQTYQWSEVEDHAHVYYNPQANTTLCTFMPEDTWLDGKVVYCILTNEYGSTRSESAEIYVDDGLRFVMQPQDAVGYYGGDAEYTVEFHNAESCEWYLIEYDKDDNTKVYDWWNDFDTYYADVWMDDNAESSTLHISPYEVEDRWFYERDLRVFCEIYDENGDSLRSEEAAFSVDQPVTATSVSLSENTLSMERGEKKTLTATVIPDHTTYKDIVWSSDDEDVVTVDQSGVITAHKEGTATIKATAKSGNKYAECVVTVKHVHEMELIREKDNSCTEAGHNAYYFCDSCGKYYKDAEALTETTLEAEATEATGHEYQEYRSYDESIHWYSCVNCGTRKDEEIHNFATVVDREATVDENGLQHEECEICGYAMTQTVIPKLEPEEKDLEITKQPEDITAELKTNVNFVTEVTGGSGELKYQWQWSKDGVKWYTCGETTYPGASTNTMTVAVKEYRDGYHYRCIVKDSKENSVTTESAVLKIAVKEAPITVSDPKSVEVLKNTDAAFSVTAESTIGSELTYQWQWSKDGEKWSTCGASTYPGAKTNTLTVAAKTYRNNYQYRCMIKDAAGNSLVSKAASLTVLLTAPVPITSSDPEDAEAYKNTNAAFTITAESTIGSELTYQWQWSKDGEKWSTCGENAYPGATTNTLTVAAKTYRDGYQYRCVIKDTNGSSLTTKAAKLEVTTVAKPTITATNPEDVTALKNNNVEFSVDAVSANGSELTYQWQWSKDGEKWSTCGEIAYPGAKTNTMTVAAKTYRNGYQYRCVIKDAQGNSLTTEAAVLTIQTEVQAKVRKQEDFTEEQIMESSTDPERIDAAESEDPVQTPSETPVDEADNSEANEELSTVEETLQEILVENESE